VTGCDGSPSPKVATPAAPPAPPATKPPPGLVLIVLPQFGVDETMMPEGLAAALSRGADRADLYFEHKVSTWLDLEDGETNRAYTEVAPGVGVRAIKGDQTGYGYTEEHAPLVLPRCVLCKQARDGADDQALEQRSRR
jgi:hypothetical protein